jgi:hypothetical protein
LCLKDWHFTQDFPEENIYRVPKYFASDWLNEYYSARTSIKDDYRFVYMGPKGSWYDIILYYNTICTCEGIFFIVTRYKSICSWGKTYA